MDKCTHQYSNGSERDVDVHGLQAVLTSDLYTAGDAGGRDGGKEVSNDQLEVLETSTDKVLTEAGMERGSIIIQNFKEQRAYREIYIKYRPLIEHRFNV